MTAPTVDHTAAEQAAYEARCLRECANWGIYGVNGKGKTTFAATIPPTIRTLVVSEGVENIKPYPEGANFTIRKIREFPQLVQIHTALRKQHCDSNGRPRIGALDDPSLFHAIVFDSWTGMQKLMTQQITGDKRPVSDEDFARMVSSAPRHPKGFDQWQQIGALSTEWMRYFQELPIHKIFLFGESTREPKAPGENHLTGPELTPLALAGARQQLELLGRLYVDKETSGGNNLLVADPAAERQIDPNTKEVRRLLIGAHDWYLTKGPTHKLGYVVTDPSWEKLAASLG
jgi:hypothetical protein